MKEQLHEEQIAPFIGEDSAGGLRGRSKYEATEAKMQEEGLTDAINKETPPVAINLAKWREDPAMTDKLQKELEGKPITVAVFGIATAGGIKSILEFATNTIKAKGVTLFAIDINRDVLREVDALGLSNVITLHEDASRTSLDEESVDLIIRDHIGNCCPPEIDRAIDKEAIRILRPHGLSMTNITTSELLSQSEDRRIVLFDELQEALDEEFIRKLQTELFDLEDMAKSRNQDCEFLRGLILEIEPHGSFGIFGSGESDIQEGIDLIGHGEWFRELADHILMWQEHGFFVEDIRSKSGLDSHVPKLSCVRHIVLLQKI